MDDSQVTDRLDTEEADRTAPGSRWHFMPARDDLDAQSARARGEVG